jgi:simple sugar transport system permease protein
MTFDPFSGAFAAAVVVAVLRAATPILLAALAGLVSEVAGAINVALEGLMLLAAFFGVIGAAYAPHWWPGLSPAAYAWIGCGCGVAAAVLASALLAFFHLECEADLIVAGIAVNLLAAGLTVFLLVTLVGDKGSTARIHTPVLPSLLVPGLAAWPVLNTLANGEGGQGHHVLTWFALLAVPLVAWLLAWTRPGKWLRAVGENVQAALGAGIPVRGMRYTALLSSGVLAGLGGVYLSMGYVSLFQADMTAGRGFLAVAAIFLGARRPLGVLGAALLFGAASVLATQLGATSIPTEIVYMIPALVTVAALVLAGRHVKRREARFA